MTRSRRHVLALALLAALAAACSTPPPAPATGSVIDGAMVRGAQGAPVTIVEFSDYQCPYCRQAEDVLARISAEYGERVRVIYRDFPLDFHAGARPAAEAARCAGESGRFWEYHDLLFVAQPAFSRADLLTYARRLGLSAEAFTACLDSGRYREAVKADVAEGRAAGVRRSEERR